MKTVTLKKNFEFMRAYKRGRFFVGRNLILYVFSTRKGENRLGISVSKKVGKSVRRNRIRRLVRENFRLLSPRLREGFDMVIVVRPKPEESLPDFRHVRKEMKFLFRKLEVWIPEEANSP